MKTKLLASSVLSLGLLAAALPAFAVEWASVTDERLLNADKDPNNWLIYGRTYNSNRFSPLKQVNTGNVKKLVPKFSYSLGTLEGQQVTPSVNNGIMIVAVSQQYVDAVDTRTGNRLWRYEIKLPADIAQYACCGLVTKGVGLYEDKVYIAALDARVIALDAKTGKELWEKKVEDYKSGYTLTMAPMVAKGKVVVGVAGGEFGIRGFIQAFDARTGQEAWKTSTVPGPGEEGVETWGKESWKYGGAAAWLTASFDPATNLVYMGTGNPAPWNRAMRPGDNRGSNSMLALDIDTGKKNWDFQFTPNDSWDYDAMSEAVLVDVKRGGKTVKGLLQGNKNGNLYTLDRTNGKFVSALPFVKVDWGHVDPATGKMVVNPESRPDLNKNATFCPSYFGGKDWAHIAYNPTTSMAFIPSIEMCATLKNEEVSYKKGLMYLGAPGDMIAPGRGALTAVDVTTNKIAWKWENSSPLQSSSALATAGGLVFVGTLEGNFVALDGKSGKKLWSFPTPSGIVGGPMTYSVDGKQYVAVVSGYGGAFPLWAGSGVPEHIKKINKGASLWVFELAE
ncbi:PQQ-dependent dehydrogenase, methanol/ethanol family [Ralstonia soli]|uniref:PQQ-dependent dehydrogenase, methanol/ethanol family n=1 Tax=Ralstonia soli TaxID=2953896 RepID=A0ABT1ATA3_9RALS|nr:PQQ-dependent dehydrogenase, methanol/ethanol family [Ralstonia soli]MCO5401714.1 PQQ-dependent dehydrogenase, methanol/ethanol family [Ralstonia soli]